MSDKTGKIEIRCNKETKIRFKKIAAEFRNFEEAIKALGYLFEENPELCHSIYREKTGYV